MTMQATESPAPQVAEAKPKTDFEKLLERDFATPRMAEAAADMREFDQRMRKATVYASSDVVPGHFKGKPSNCYIAIEMAERLKVDPLTVMQNTYVISGKLGFSGQFAIAIINASGLFEGSLEFDVACDEADDEGSDPSYRVRCLAVPKGKTKAIRGPWVTWKMVKAEGWSARNGSKWQSIPDMMFRYRAAAFFGRTVCPQALMGFHTVEELIDAGETEFMPPNGKANGHALAKTTLKDIVEPKREEPAVAQDGHGANVPPVAVAGSPAPVRVDEPQADAGTALVRTTRKAKEAPIDPPAPDDDDPRTNNDKATEYAENVPVYELKNWLMKLPATVRNKAMELAGIETLIDTDDQSIRNTAFNAKLAELNS